MILDFGLAEWILPASSIDMTVIGGEYFQIEENSRLTNPGKGRGVSSQPIWVLRSTLILDSGLYVRRDEESQPRRTD